MILDTRCEIASNLTLPTATGTSVITSAGVIDTALLNPATGTPFNTSSPMQCDVYLVILASVAITCGTTTTLEYLLQSSASSTITSTPNIHFRSRPKATGTSLAAGTVLAVTRMPSDLDMLRHIGVVQVNTGAVLTGGAVDIFFTPDAARWTALADNVGG